MWLRAYDAWKEGDRAPLARWNDECLAARETAELRAETMQMGVSLVRVMPALGIAPPTCSPIAFPMAFAAACAALGLDREAGLAAYLWAWAENQVLVAVKSVPLGQMAGQALLAGLAWGWIPCGMVYAALPLALVAGGPWQGALVMLAFGAGTLPSMVTATIAFEKIARSLAARATLRNIAGALLLAFGLWTAGNALYHGAMRGGQGQHGEHQHH